MAFNKKQSQYFQKNEEIAISNDDVKKFEKELEPYYKRKTKLFNGREITGFELYLHNSFLFRFSPQYPDGAIIASNAEKYREAKAKFSALQDLNDRREKSKSEEERRLQTLAI